MEKIILIYISYDKRIFACIIHYFYFSTFSSILNIIKSIKIQRLIMFFLLQDLNEKICAEIFVAKSRID